ncbi:sulfotransferase [Aestuariibacter halophilus]|uniref:Sulfotransferase n=1 Tax=Fluctibacter halophilus TaxID=226011 RepID=A0ABS8G303_9ALTE|nr:sulfotransferase [Aestuariibacter halophilus]MCC2614869.1 sulfotransferase [Aestuariibacter halophilus]
MATPPIFIVGVQRSGTTFLRLIFNRHPEISIPFESNFLDVISAAVELDFYDWEQKKSLMENILNEPLTQKGGITFPDMDKLREVHSPAEMISALFDDNSRREGKTRWGVKTPHYIIKMHEILHFFPDARIIALVRDPRGIFVSQKSISWGAKQPSKLAYFWNMAIQSVEMIETLFPNNIRVVRYCDLITDTEEVVKSLCGFAQCDFVPEMLDFDNHKSVLPKDSVEWHKNSVRRPDPRKVEEWREKLSPFDNATFVHLCGEGLKRFGYEAIKPSFNLPQKVLKRLRSAIYYS